MVSRRTFLHRTQIRENGGIREYHERLILHKIRQHQEIPSADLVRETGLSMQSVSRITKRLIELGLIEKRGRRRIKGKVGQPSVPLALKPDGAYSVGVKIGRKSLDIIAIDNSARVMERMRQEYDFPEPNQVIAASNDGISSILSGLSVRRRKRIVGLGVVAPYGLAERYEELGSPASLALQWANTDLGAVIAREHDLPIWFDHDAKAACLADLLLHNNPARPGNYLFVSLGTIIGGGIVADGALVRGPQGYAGAVGPLPVPGVLDPFASADPDLTVPLLRVASCYVLNAMVRAAGKDPAEIESGTVPPGCPIVTDWISRASSALAIAILSAVSTFEFEAVVLDGDLPPALLERLGNRLSNSLDGLDFTGLIRPKLLMGDLGNRARALGGALLPFYHNFAPQRKLLVKAR